MDLPRRGREGAAARSCRRTAQGRTGEEQPVQTAGGEFLGARRSAAMTATSRTCGGARGRAATRCAGSVVPVQGASAITRSRAGMPTAQWSWTCSDSTPVRLALASGAASWWCSAAGALPSTCTSSPCSGQVAWRTNAKWANADNCATPHANATKTASRRAWRWHGAVGKGIRTQGWVRCKSWSTRRASMSTPAGRRGPQPKVLPKSERDP